MGIDDDYLNEVKSGREPAGVSVSVPEEKPIPHYYGDIVRTLLIGASVLLLLSILFDKDLLAFNIVVGVTLVLVITIFAGLTSPRNYLAILVDTIVAAVLFVLYEFLAVTAYYRTESILDIAFALRQGIAFTALGALYFSIKSIRGLRRIEIEEEEK